MIIFNGALCLASVLPPVWAQCLLRLVVGAAVAVALTDDLASWIFLKLVSSILRSRPGQVQTLTSKERRPRTSPLQITSSTAAKRTQWWVTPVNTVWPMWYGQGKAGRGEMVIIYSKKVVGEDQRSVKEKKGSFLTLGPLHTHAYTTPHPTTHHTHARTRTKYSLLRFQSDNHQNCSAVHPSHTTAVTHVIVECGGVSTAQL